MELQKITKQDLDEFYEIYKTDFCYGERRSKGKLKDTLDEEKFSSNYICYDGAKVGYINFWDFDEFVYIEHIAIFSSMRGTGYGSKSLSEFIDLIKRNIILEVEPPEDEISIKRIHFYEKIGFVLNDYDYVQPSYHGKGKGLPMKLMTFGKAYDNKTLKKYVNTIYKNVYKV